MAMKWKIEPGDVTGGDSGQLLDGLVVVENVQEGCFDLIAVLAKSEGNVLPAKFPTFAYRGLVWNLEITQFNPGVKGDQPYGPWSNNQNQRYHIVGEEDGTWTAQAGSGGMGDDGEEDAASASA